LIQNWIISSKRFRTERFNCLDEVLQEVQKEKSMSVKTSPPALLTILSDHEVVLSRIFEAPRELVFRAHTDPDLIPQWWGLRSNTTIVAKMDVRLGGMWRFIQRDVEGQEFAFHGEYREVVSPDRLVNTFEFEGVSGHIILDTSTFEELPDGRTQLTATSLFASIADRDGMLNSGMESGSNEAWDRLAELLARLS
jgi:uncharacterized protein YndB with AHSA1/START domain